MSFSAPSSNGGAAISKYTVTSSPGGKTATGTGSPITVTGLTNGTSYTFTVTATNSAGTGPASAASNAVTPHAAGGGTPIPNLANGWDVDAAVTASEVSCMKGAGYSYSLLYTNIDATDWQTTYSALNANGMQAILQQGYGDGTMYNDSSTGTTVGNDNVASAQSVNYPQGADFFLDVESTGSATESSLIDWINNWAKVVSAAGYTPGRVFGSANGLAGLGSVGQCAAERQGVLAVGIVVSAGPGAGLRRGTATRCRAGLRDRQRRGQGHRLHRQER